MARNSGRFLGLTVKQWSLVIAIILILLFLACRAIYNLTSSLLNSDKSETTASQTPTQTPPPVLPKTTEEAKQTFLLLGNPSNATSDTSNANNYLMVSPYYALSYNRDKGLPNWVSWRLTANDLGTVERSNDFRPDDRLPNGWPRVSPGDYSNSGFDRGHLCPSADRTNTPEANSATFLMTNMTPQTPDLNQGTWEKLESYSRSMARRGVDLYIIAGQYGTKGTMKGKVAIPTNFWKIVVVLPAGKGISAINNSTRVIAVDMPNVNGIKERNWREFVTTVRQIEQKTGYNFLSSLPQGLQDFLENKTDRREK
jgi:endonuclease G